MLQVPTKSSHDRSDPQSEAGPAEGGEEGNDNRGVEDSPDALRSRTLWSSRAIHSAQPGHLHGRWPAAAAAARVGYIPPAVCFEKKKKKKKTGIFMAV